MRDCRMCHDVRGCPDHAPEAQPQPDHDFEVCSCEEALTLRALLAESRDLLESLGDFGRGGLRPCDDKDCECAFCAADRLVPRIDQAMNALGAVLGKERAGE